MLGWPNVAASKGGQVCPTLRGCVWLFLGPRTRTPCPITVLFYFRHTGPVTTPSSTQDPRVLAMKERVSLLDVLALTRDLRAVATGCRVQQVYSSHGRRTILKLSATGQQPLFLLLDPGAMFAVLRAQPVLPPAPSNFASKLRKHCNGRRITGVRQLGADRVIDIRLGSGKFETHILLELYAGGNTILTDADLTILTMQRTVLFASGAKIAAGKPYPLADAANVGAAEHEGEQPAAGPLALSQDDNALIPALQAWWDQQLGVVCVGRKAKSTRTPVKLLSAKGTGVSHFGPVFMEHALRSAGQDVKIALGCDEQGVSYSASLSREQAAAMVASWRSVGHILRAVQDATPGSPLACGFVLLQLSNTAPSAAASGAAAGLQARLAPALCAAAVQACSQELVPLAYDALHDGASSSIAALSVEQFDAALHEQLRLRDPALAATLAVAGKREPLWWRTGTPADITPTLLAQHVHRVSSWPAAQEWASSPSAAHAAPMVALVFPSFNAAADEYWGYLAMHRVAASAQAAADAAQAKLERAQARVSSQVDALHDRAATARHHAQCLQAGLADADAVLSTLRAAGEAGLQQRQVDLLVRDAARRGEPLAAMVSSCSMLAGSAKLWVPDVESELVVSGRARGGTQPAQRALQLRDVAAYFSHGRQPLTAKELSAPIASQASPGSVGAGAHAEPAQALVEVEVDFSTTAAQNVRAMFSSAKTADSGAIKAEQAGQAAITAAARGVEATAGKLALASAGAAAAAAGPGGVAGKRRTYWFEKFRWFISGEGVLVVGGRDAGQNELLVSRYLRPQDAFVHADAHGAGAVVVRSPWDSPAAAARLPSLGVTLGQAGTFAAALSSLWKGGAAGSVKSWWAYAEQVSKSAPSGEFLPTGSFLVRGTKNYIPVPKLEMGIALVFRVPAALATEYAPLRTLRAAGGRAEGGAEPSSAEHAPAASGGKRGEAAALLHTATGRAARAPHRQHGAAAAARAASAKLAPVPEAKRVSERTARKKARAAKRRAGRHGDSSDDEEDQLLRAMALGKAAALQPSATSPAHAGGAAARSTDDGDGCDSDSSEPAVLQSAHAASGLQGVGGDYGEAPDDMTVRTASLATVHTDMAQASIQVGGRSLAGDEAVVATLVGKAPMQGQAQYAMAMCAPWSALARGYDMKAKLVAGTGKPGRTAKDIQHVWVGAITKQLSAMQRRQAAAERGAAAAAAGQDPGALASARQAAESASAEARGLELLSSAVRAVPDDEWVKAMLSGVKCSAVHAWDDAGKSAKPGGKGGGRGQTKQAPGKKGSKKPKK